MNLERLDEIEKNIINNPTIDKAVVQSILQECIDEIRRLNNNFIYAKPGQHIIIRAKTNSHEFEIGQECIVTEWYWFSEEEDGSLGVEASSLDNKETWLVKHTDYLIK
ncbi:hypothetical protein ACH6EH_07190 [Paenibacillus sp. JSM ZJ436]|uniref:hypothetical protein n=1 Tax=Paenibacillus sp. JSM ZJ436 TaxID=3376190 RepID=UPI0037AA16C8